MNKKPNKKTIILYLFFGLVVLNLLIMTGGGLYIIKIRNNISQSAENIKNLERSISRSYKDVQQIDSKIATAESPKNLIARSKSLKLNLQPPENNQIINLSFNGPKIIKKTINMAAVQN